MPKLLITRHGEGDFDRPVPGGSARRRLAGTNIEANLRMSDEFVLRL
jgi:hypothetical protein